MSPDSGQDNRSRRSGDGWSVKRTDEGWHVDKKVPVALIIALVVQTGGAFWWAATVTSQVEAAIKQGQENREDIKATATIEPRLVRVETDITYMRRAIDVSNSQIQQIDQKLTDVLRVLQAPSPRR